MKVLGYKSDFHSKAEVNICSYANVIFGFLWWGETNPVTGKVLQEAITKWCLIQQEKEPESGGEESGESRS